MSKIDQLFADLKAKNERAFMPFITAGDPNIEFSLQLIREFDSIGCHLCEVGIPYSDPIADGPVIQASYSRALDSGFQLDDLFQQMPETATNISMPLVSMVSYSIIYRKGLSNYVAAAKQAGFSGAIVPDCPLESVQELSAVCRDADFSLIQLVTPTTPLERAREIASYSTGFIYFVSVTGITGERANAPDQALSKISQLRDHTDLPICLGFGISTPEHVEAIGDAVDGFIVGSAIVRRVAEQCESDKAVSQISEFAQSVLSAVQKLKS